jgi:endonuclease/exonuclease/phosphatase family metal-dependent hydrolase
VRICTWNIQLGLRIDAVLDTVREHHDFRQVDLFGIQEASVHSGRQDAAAIAAAMGKDFDHFQATAQLYRGHEQGNGLVWRRSAFQPAPPGIVSLSEPGATINRAERALLRAVQPQHRIAIRAESHALRVYVMHLDVIGFTHKLQQLRAVIDDMAGRPAVPLTVVAGDLNTFGPPRLQLWRRLGAAARDAGLVELTRGIRRTHWTAQKLDAIFIHAATTPTHHAWTLNVRASDHLPVFAEI